MLEARLDHARAVSVLRKAGHLALAKDYLLSVQKSNIPAVNDAVNELLVEEGDAAALAESVAQHDAFDARGLATRLETHPDVAFRRVAASIFTSIGAWDKAVSLATKDGLSKEAVAAAAASNDPAVAESLMRHYVEAGEKECFAATLFACASLLKPDVVLEAAWAHGVVDAAMPFLIQSLRDVTTKVDTLMTERDAAKKAAASTAGGANGEEYAHMLPLALPAAPGGGGGGGGPAF